MDDYDYCYECGGYGDGYHLDENGEWVVVPAVHTIHWKEIMKMNNEKDTCATCSHFIGGGDWNLCCDLKYDLCYSCTTKCSKYKERKEESR